MILNGSMILLFYVLWYYWSTDAQIDIPCIYTVTEGGLFMYLDSPLAEHTEILQKIMQEISVKRLPKILESSNL